VTELELSKFRGKFSEGPLTAFGDRQNVPPAGWQLALHRHRICIGVTNNTSKAYSNPDLLLWPLLFAVTTGLHTMSELAFCKQFLSALDARPIKLSSDHIADARQYPAQAAVCLL
jgi:hypothetical protein